MKGSGRDPGDSRSNLPFSKQAGDWYCTGTPGSRGWRIRGLTSPFFAGSAIYRLRPMFNVMLESVASSNQTASALGVARVATFTLSPGFRGGWNIGEKQVVAGFALPVSWTAGTSDTGAFLYFSYELPFKK